MAKTDYPRSDSGKRGMEFKKIARILEDIVIESLLLFLVVMNAMNIASRYVLHKSIGDTFELMILLAVALYWFGIGTAQTDKAHLGMGFIVSNLRGNVKKTADIFRNIVVIFFLVMIIISSCMMVYDQYLSETTTAALLMPRWIFSIPMPIGFAIMLKRVILPDKNIYRLPDETGDNQK